jgi:glycosyltransferase involved in cell wall biosynthesis
MSFSQKSVAVIMTTINNPEMLVQTVPSFASQMDAVDGVLVIYDCSTGDNRKRVSEEIERIRVGDEILLIQSDNVSASIARNVSFELCRQKYNPSIVGFIEDDHIAKDGFLSAMQESIVSLYGKVSDSGLRVGLFSGCSKCNGGDRTYLNEDNDFTRSADQPVSLLGGLNACCRFAPMTHWLNVLGQWDVDEYLISEFQTRGVGTRNYNRGFCSAIIGDGKFLREIYQDGRGTSDSSSLRLWDNAYTASDNRSAFKGKGAKDEGSKRIVNVLGRTKHLLKGLIR